MESYSYSTYSSSPIVNIISLVLYPHSEHL